jgi:hypothetical protein
MGLDPDVPRQVSLNCLHKDFYALTIELPAYQNSHYKNKDFRLNHKIK